MRTFVVGDIHGAFKALKQCLERSEFDYTNDKLIVLGDIVDGWPEVYESIEELLKINNLIVIRGNHDDWFRTFLTKGFHPVNWLQGGEGTLESYCNQLGCKMFLQMGTYKTTLNNTIIPKSHINFFTNKQISYFVDENNNCFVHGGFNHKFSITNTTVNNEEELMWNRSLFSQALSHRDQQHVFKIHDEFNEVFIGHTPTLNWGVNTPMKAANIWNLDTGAGYNGKLTIMDIKTKEYWQSDLVTELYKGKKGRN
jgi:serine/threonine protein phosphatase 1